MLLKINKLEKFILKKIKTKTPIVTINKFKTFTKKLKLMKIGFGK
jgi:hypothetical protein